MSEPLRPTRALVELIDATVEQPTPGSRVLALTLGNTLVPTIWTNRSHETLYAWCHYPKVPSSVKRRMMLQYMDYEEVA